MRTRDDMVEMVFRLIVMGLIIANFARDPLPKKSGEMVAINQGTTACEKENP